MIRRHGSTKHGTFQTALSVTSTTWRLKCSVQNYFISFLFILIIFAGQLKKKRLSTKKTCWVYVLEISINYYLFFSRVFYYSFVIILCYILSISYQWPPWPWISSWNSNTSFSLTRPSPSFPLPSAQHLRVIFIQHLSCSPQSNKFKSKNIKFPQIYISVKPQRGK